MSYKGRTPPVARPPPFARPPTSSTRPPPVARPPPFARPPTSSTRPPPRSTYNTASVRREKGARTLNSTSKLNREERVRRQRKIQQEENRRLQEELKQKRQKELNRVTEMLNHETRKNYEQEKLRKEILDARKQLNNSQKARNKAMNKEYEQNFARRSKAAGIGPNGKYNPSHLNVAEILRKVEEKAAKARANIPFNTKRNLARKFANSIQGKKSANNALRYFYLLGYPLKKDSKQLNIRQAYLKLSLLLHPNKLMKKNNNGTNFKYLSDFYQLLSGLHVS